MNKLKKGLAALIVLAAPASAALIASPAHAVGYGTASARATSPTTIAVDGCTRAYYQIDTFTDDYTWYATLTVDVIAPNGSIADLGFASVDTDVYNQTHQFDAFMCSSLDARGTYTIKPTIKACDSDFDCTTYPGTPATFTYADPTPPPPPPPPPVTPVDVTGTHSLLAKTSKTVKVAFAANNLGANQSQRTRLTYSIKAGNRTAATVLLSAGQTVTKTVKVPKNKTTKFKILRNGVTVQSFKVKGA